MNIVLVNPPAEEWSGIAKNKYRKSILNIIAPLGIAYIAAVLEKNSYQVKIFDCLIGISQLELMRDLKNSKPNIVGIAATTLSIESAKKMALEACKACKGIKP